MRLRVIEARITLIMVSYSLASMISVQVEEKRKYLLFFLRERHAYWVLRQKMYEFICVQYATEQDKV